MPDSFVAYAEWIELETFFSGYLLVYAIIFLMASGWQGINFAKTKLLPNLPTAYAFAGTLYWGLQLKNMYPDYTVDHLIAGTQLHYLKIWGLLSILFWIPVLRKKAVFSLLHSLVFFYLMITRLYLQFVDSTGNDLAGNTIKIYSASILLNLLSLLFVTFISFLIGRFHSQKRSVP